MTKEAEKHRFVHRFLFFVWSLTVTTAGAVAGLLASCTVKDIAMAIAIVSSGSVTGFFVTYMSGPLPGALCVSIAVSFAKTLVEVVSRSVAVIVPVFSAVAVATLAWLVGSLGQTRTQFTLTILVVVLEVCISLKSVLLFTRFIFSFQEDIVTLSFTTVVAIISAIVSRHVNSVTEKPIDVLVITLAAAVIGSGMMVLTVSVVVGILGASAGIFAGTLLGMTLWYVNRREIKIVVFLISVATLYYIHKRS